jgi:acyl-coenzyme A synthetase/AMP-(fatty) acid ligase
MPPAEARWLRDWLADTAEDHGRRLIGRTAQVALGALAGASSLDTDPADLRGRSVLIITRDQLTAALALIELDGVARRLTLVPPDVPRAQIPQVMTDAAVDAVVLEDVSDDHDIFGAASRVICSPQLRPLAHAEIEPLLSEWVLFTSGTTGTPKMVVHSLAGLTGAIGHGGIAAGAGAGTVWGTFYDIRRYGGLQIFLRALHDGGSLVLSDAKEPVGDFLVRLGRQGVTHMSGTPSHWRRALMSASARAMSPRYVRLSGEIADQAVLDSLAAFYKTARVGHAYASTEAGVGFDVNDGREGFPASLIGAPGPVEMKVVDGTLRIRSARTAARYVGAAVSLADADGFVDTGDMLERVGDRYHFAGRKGGIINVGGLKVHPEEVEAVINRHPQVRMSLVRPRKSPITGAIVVAEVVLREDDKPGGAEVRAGRLRDEILGLCRARLPQHKVPAMIRFVPALAVAASGKLERPHA